MKKFLHSVVERIKSRREGRTSTQYQIFWNLQGVRVDWLDVENNRGSLAFSWDSVRTVDTFKRDFFMVDCICLAVQTPDGWIEVNEDMRGWREFLAAVESKLPGFPLLSSWYGKVMLPPFEANHARLWERKPGSQNQSLEATAAGA